MASTVKLSNGQRIPILGLGTWKSKPNEVTEAVKYAIDIGYRHFDCAFIYQNEKEVGAGLSSKFKEGVVKREDVWVTSKLWNTYHEPHLVEVGLRKTLSNLQLEYLDLFLIHWPHDRDGNTIYSDVDYVDTWKAMEECVRKGLTKSIGLSNFNSEQVERVMKAATIKPVVNQVECHPYLTQKKLRAFCEERGIQLTAYSPLGSPDRPFADPNAPKLLEDPKLKTIADKYGKTPAQILIRYQIQRGNVVIPKSVTKERIRQNFQVFDFELSREDMSVVDSFDIGGRLVLVVNAKAHKYYPFKIEY
ncbi:UNVERIFIED_CONTAM: hypothetical protein PYX00_005435 [Menopon gallinae]|uniref:NADP-dependent oxidoreductase domain-containing protein n=1 Tax=Menopon gallinae TaxID=328185 RepID=A0AAW2HRC3_9NEOP